MRSLLKLIKYAVLLGFLLSVLFATAVLSVVPVLALRYLLLPEYLLSVPVDFLSKNVHKSSFSVSRPYMVANVDLSSFEVSKHRYSVDLHLTLPRSDSNLELGNFVVRGAIGDKNWVASSSPDISEADVVERMALIPFKSPFVEKASRIIFAPLYITGFMTEESIITVKMWTDAVQLQHRYLLLTLPNDIMVSHAEIALEVQLRGFRRLLRQFPITSTLFLSCVVFSGTVTMLLVSCIMLYAKFTQNGLSRETTSIRPKGPQKLIESKEKESSEKHAKNSMENDVREKEKPSIETSFTPRTPEVTLIGKDGKESQILSALQRSPDFSPPRISKARPLVELSSDDSRTLAQGYLTPDYDSRIE